MKRFFDILLVMSFAPVWLPLYGLVFFVVLISSGFPVIYWSKRIGRGGVIFLMPKFRTMKLDTPTVATDLLINPQQYLIPWGRFLRKTSLDELPQLISVLRGQMSIVGPRPALFNQEQLIRQRALVGIDMLRPGLTGWAQVNGRDDLSDQEKVSYDQQYLQRQSLLFDIKIIGLTVLKVIKSDGVAH
ncbi:sugar transferase [Polynucleobacter victoriensis]|uniref:O-antigen biosynthesis protein WbqP n=1 Tax=Polynucleobacter victoriensis TaxID=2049319 RepID=A0A212T7Y3_9BURK|nr:sugar transferase [Polynucleobacter victoriensis]SNC62129.1 O-antigen biosynthesis protein WbqP [Polynucleobacter victoriensis]